MRVVSVNLGVPREILHAGRSVRTGIFKDPTAGPVELTAGGLQGDGQADLVDHGGTYKAVYAYPSEHYADWRVTHGEVVSRWGAFGENLTIEGLLETDVRVGDRLEIGTALLQAAQPRKPCSKLGIRLADPGAPKRFVALGRPGIYLAVVSPGTLSAGDAVSFDTRAAEDAPTVSEVAEWAYHGATPDQALRALACESLAPEWRKPLERILKSA